MVVLSLMNHTPGPLESLLRRIDDDGHLPAPTLALLARLDPSRRVRLSTSGCGMVILCAVHAARASLFLGMGGETIHGAWLAAGDPALGGDWRPIAEVVASRAGEMSEHRRRLGGALAEDEAMRTARPLLGEERADHALRQAGVG